MKVFKNLCVGAGLAGAFLTAGQASATGLPSCNTLTDLSVAATACSGWYDGNLLNNGHNGADVTAQFNALNLIGLNWDRDWATVDLTKVGPSGSNNNIFDFKGTLNGDVWIGIFKGVANGPDHNGFSGTAFYRLTVSDLDAVTLNLPGASSAVVYAQQSAVPEPETWAMLLVGFGAIGLAMRRRRCSPPRPLPAG